MISYEDGDLFTSGAEALVNPVNCVGISGKGLAKEFARRFPANQLVYESMCAARAMRLGRVLAVRLMNDEMRLTDPPTKWVINFPTKLHWRDSSTQVQITEGLMDLRREIVAHKMRSVAVPALGCGLGRLAWETVRPAIEGELSTLVGVDVFVYPPKSVFQGDNYA